MKNFKQLLRQVKAFAFDVDGVLSSDSIPLSPEGEPMRVINTKDGYALKQAVVCGFPVAIITGGNTLAVRKRFESLGIQDIYMGSSYTLDRLKDFMKKYELKAEEILFMGDDIPDYEALKHVGVPTCPADAVSEIKEICCYVSHLKGGEGCGRDVIEQVLKLNGKWMHNVEAFGW
jgi:3-deoxy-D-manno-octulosonate 8-phosphate phosphatase (KDO 8-P phosphatase)